MLFRKDVRKREIIERAMKQVEKVLRDMQDDGLDLTTLKLKKYQKTHFTSCLCPKCNDAKRKNNPRLRGILEEGYKVYVGEGSGAE